MTPERIAELRQLVQNGFDLGRALSEDLLDALDAANAELSRLRSSPAPVVGGVPELTDAELDAIYPESFQLGTHHHEIHRALLRKVIASATGKRSLRVPALKPGEVVVDAEEWRELRAFARISGYPEGRFTFEVPFGRDLGEWGTDIAHRMGITRDEEQAWLDSRAQATTTEKEPA
jgi:hypothetical protein